MQVIIPPSLQEKMVTLLHESHLGIDRMKALARSYVWWPGMEKKLEEMTKQCQGCQINHKEDPKTPLHPLEFTWKPWQRIHLDFAGPFQGQMWLIAIDSYSELRLIFARFGSPEQVVTDNGPQFVGHELREFMEANGIQHV